MAPEKGGCISFFSFAMINTMIKRELERKGFVFAHRSESFIKGSQGRTQTGNMEVSCLLACSPWLTAVLNLLFIGVGDTTCLGDATAHSGVGPPSHISY